ncbi:hypothetical protein [Carboxydothermus ferrireducens]|uniref:Uncharacterized protein n=1 Tax=Carboxydothermus ferrireducens DSM 11255 TaxID=1119529 RepID=A0ABX2R7M3_9THEO|nr:hypothetical protein [Carboxydothermus ferrireducens]NYE57167.1 hypothetical protein [Carboxydothermus ferrireducens DSM 11255]
MPGRHHLRERDIKFLQFIGRYGYITLDQAKEFFGTSYYHYRRILVLEEHGYISKIKSKYLRLTQKGREIAGINEQTRLGDIKQIERRVLSAELDIKFRGLPLGWEWIPSFEVKEKDTTFSPTSKFNGLLKNKDRIYLTYVLPAKPKEKYVDTVKLEMEKLSDAGYIRAIVFCKSPLAIKMFGDKNRGMNELHVLPYPNGVQLLPFLNPEMVQQLGRELFGSIIVGENPQADFTIIQDGRKIDLWFLATSDLAKLNTLKSHVKIFSGAVSSRSNAVLCLEQQRNYYQEQFPELPVYTFSLDKVLGRVV